MSGLEGFKSTWREHRGVRKHQEIQEILFFILPKPASLGVDTIKKDGLQAVWE